MSPGTSTSQQHLLQPWQRANVLAAVNYFRERLARSPDDARARAVHDGLLEVLDPARRRARQQRELSEASKAAAATLRQERRRQRDRRTGADRRAKNQGAPEGSERRAGERRAGRDRRAGR
jgi:hypothetical protein